MLTSLARLRLIKLISRDKLEYGCNTKTLGVKDKYYLLIKKKKIERYLSIFLNKPVEIKLKNFIKSLGGSRKFRLIYKKFYRALRMDKINFFNKQFKEIYSSISIGIYLSSSKLIVYLFSLVIGYGRYRSLKKICIIYLT